MYLSLCLTVTIQLGIYWRDGVETLHVAMLGRLEADGGGRLPAPSPIPGY